MSGWRPDFLPAHEQLQRQAARLRDFVGDRLETAWIVWDLERDTWLADLPVVLVLNDGRQLEVCWEKFDDLSITWDTIDLAVKPRAWVDWPLEWRQEAHSALAAAMPVGELVQVAATRSSTHIRRSAERHDADRTWATTGLWFEGPGGTGVHVLNALDENGLSSTPPLRDPHHECSPV